MAKVVLNSFSSLANQSSFLSGLNTNFSRITTAMEKTLSRDGTSPNEMNSNLDMNNKRIYNLPAPASDTEPVRYVDLAILNAGNAELAVQLQAAIDEASGFADNAADSANSAYEALSSILGIVESSTTNDPYLEKAKGAITLPIRPYSFVGGRLLAGYTGYSVRVTRSSDSSTLDVGWNSKTKGIDFTAIDTFLESDTGYITRWYDQGSRGGYWTALPGSLNSYYTRDTTRDALLPSLVSNPYYGLLPGIYSNLSPDSPVVMNRRTFSYFGLIYPVSSFDAGYYVSLFSSNSPITETFSLGTLGSTSSPALVGLNSVIDGNLATYVTSSTLVPKMQPTVVGVTSSVSAMKHWIDGTSSSHAAQTSQSVVGLSLGFTPTSSGMYGNYDHYLSVFYDRALTDAEAAIVQRALKNAVRTPKTPVLRIVIDGDSRSAATATTNLFTWGKFVEAMYGTKVEFYNMSYPGKTAAVSSTNYAAVCAPLYTSGIPCIYYNTCGVNDINNGVAGATVYTSLKAALAAAKVTGFTTMTSTCYPIKTMDAAKLSALATFNTAVRAGYNADYDMIVDYGDYAPFLLTSNTDIFPDGVHLSSTAQESVAGFVSGGITSLVDLNE